MFVGPQGVLVLFAAGEHARWRLLVVQAHRPGGATEPPTADIRAAVEVLTGGRVRARTVAWTAQIVLQHRLAATFRPVACSLPATPPTPTARRAPRA